MAWQLDFAMYPADGFVATEGCVELSCIDWLTSGEPQWAMVVEFSDIVQASSS